MNSDICIIPGCIRVRDKKQNRKICQMHRVRYSRYKSYDLPTAPQLPQGILKVCKKHGNLTALEVYKRTPGKDWLSCRICCKERNIRAKQNYNHEKNDSSKKYYYVKKDKIKILKEDYLAILNKQNNVCAICNNPETQINSKVTLKPRRLTIDHCHKTKKIRGLLCYNCNLLLGYAKDCPDLLNRAIDYLKIDK